MQRVWMPAAILAVLLVSGCGGSSNESTLTLNQRLLPASTFTGYFVPKIFEWKDANGPASEGFGLVRATPTQAVNELDSQGFVAGDGELLQNARQDHYSVMVLRFHTQNQAQAVQVWEHHDLLLPCAHACNTRISEFAVDGIPGSEGVNRVVGVPTAEGPTIDRWIVSFVKGPVLYIVERSGDAGKLKNGHDDVVNAVKREYDRVKNASFPNA